MSTAPGPKAASAIASAGTSKPLVPSFDSVTPVPVARPLPVALGGSVSQSVRAAASVFEDDGSGE